MKSFKIVIILFFLVLFMTACRAEGPSPALTPVDRSATSVSPTDMPGPEMPPESDADEAELQLLLDELAENENDLQERVQGMSLVAMPEVTAAGSEILFEGDVGLAGTLVSVGGRLPEAAFSAGNGLLTIPAGTPDGIYYVILQTDAGIAAWTSVRVASSPGVWLRVDRQYKVEGVPVRLSVQAYDLPESAVGAVYATDDANSEPVPYVPDENGVLFPGAPVPVAELTGRILTLPGAVSGLLQVNTGPDLFTESESPNYEYSSDPWSLSICSEYSMITGQSDGPAIANAVWFEGSVRSWSVMVAGDSYQLAVRPGVVLVQVAYQDGTRSEGLVSVGCGEVVEITESGEELNKSAAFPMHAFSSTTGLFRNSPNLLLQPGGDEVCRSAVILPYVSVDGELDEEISQGAGLALKTVISEKAPRASVLTYADIQSLFEQAAEAMEAGEGDEPEELPALELAIAAVQSDFLVNLRAARLGRSMAAVVSGLPMLEGDAQVNASGSGRDSEVQSPGFGVYQDFSDKFSHAAICGEVQPEDSVVNSSEQVELDYRLTDLAGEDIDGADVKISTPACGELDPDNGSTEGGMFETTYTYPDDTNCVENLDFTAEWSGPSGGVKTEPKEAIAHIAPEPVTVDLYAGFVPGVSQEAYLASAQALLEERQLKVDPAGGTLAAIFEAGDCKFLEGGNPVNQQFWMAQASAGGQKAEGYTSAFNLDEYDLAAIENGVVPQGRQLRFFTRASAFPTRDDGVSRVAAAFAGNFSDVFITGQIASTVFLFDIHNPSKLTNISPQFVWESQVSNDGGGYETFIFYKVINCGTDAGLSGMETFFSLNGTLLMSFSEEEAGALNGSVVLPDIKEERYQVLMYVMSVSSAGSIQDTEYGIYHSAITRMQVDVLMNFVQGRGRE